MRNVGRLGPPRRGPGAPVILRAAGPSCNAAPGQIERSAIIPSVMQAPPSDPELEPAVRRWLPRLPTRALRRFIWDRIKRQRHTQVVSTVFGARMHCDTRDFIQRYVYYFGVWEPNLTAWLPQRLRPGDVFVDVGANIGYFALLAARTISPDGRVVAIEPSDEVKAALDRNLALNPGADVRVVHAAATDVGKDLSVIFGGEHDMGGTRTVDPAAASTHGTRIQGKPLYDLLDATERAKARLVKIDVEGAEWDVLTGLHLERGGYRDDLELIVEVAPQRLRQQGRDADALIARMKSLGFNAYRLANDYRVRAYLHRTPVAFPVRLLEPVSEQTDVVFSRIDAERL
jgi:FkbM family methyltransferase